MNTILEVKNLLKHYGPANHGFTAVNNVSFALGEGEILALLGPNGAGKSTTIQMLLGITTPNSGTINYFGKDFFQNKRYCLQRINYASAFNNLQGRVSVWENLLVSSYLYQVKNPENRIRELVEYFSVKHILNSRYYDLSTGERTRINLIKSLLNSPKILLLDEPTASLDPDIADRTLSFIEEIRKNLKVSILYTSHNMAEVERICDRVIFLNHGRIVAQDTSVNLKTEMGAISLEEVFLKISRKPKIHVD